MATGDLVLLVLAWLGTYVLHSTLLLGGTYWIARRRSDSQPRLCERMWKLAALGSLLTASAQVAFVAEPLLGRLSLGTLAGPSAVETAAAEPATTEPVTQAPVETHEPIALARLDEPARTRARPRAERPVRSGARPRSEPARPFAPIPEAADVAREPVPFFPTTEPEQVPAPAADAPRGDGLQPEESRAVDPVDALALTARSLPWRDLFLGAWAALGGLGLLGFLWSWSRLSIHLSGRRELTEGDVAARFRQLCARARVRGRIRLTTSPKVGSPITHGWFVREVTLPERALTDLSPRQLDTVLAHELAHALRRDPVWFGLFVLLERVFFFQPLNRIARRSLHDVTELLCDDWAVRWTGGRLALASTLTEIAQWIVARERRPLLTSGMAGAPSRLGVRVERLLDDRRSPVPERPRAWWSPAALATLALFVLAVPRVSFAAPPADEAPVDGPTLQSLLEAELAEPSLGLVVDHELLETEMRLLEAEMEALRSELDENELTGHFEVALATLDQKLTDLRARKERLNTLLARLISLQKSHDLRTP